MGDRGLDHINFNNKVSITFDEKYTIKLSV